MNIPDLCFSWFLAATTRGSLLAAVVIAIGFVLRGRMPARWRYVLWLPVLFVLAAPRLPQSPWSAEHWLFGGASVRSVAVVDVGAPERLSAGDVATSNPVGSMPREGFEWRRVAGATWLMGVVGMLTFSIVTYARTLRRIRREAVPADASMVAMLCEAAVIAGMRRIPELVVSPAVQSPAVCGFLRPVILLPAEFPGTLTTNEARLVLLHELMHLKGRDLPLNWLLCVLQALHWCNPWLWIAFARLRADREAACDAQVLAANGNDCRADYGHALLKLESGMVQGGLSLGFVGIFERSSGIGSRIRAIATHRRSHPAWAVLGSAFLVALTVVGATHAQSPTKGDSTARVEPNAEIQRKLKSIVIPDVQFREVTIQEAFSYLAKQSVELDAAEPDSAKRGVKIFLKIDELKARVKPADGQPIPLNPLDARITISLKKIPLIEAIKYVTGLADLQYRINAQGVEVVPMNVAMKNAPANPKPVDVLPGSSPTGGIPESERIIRQLNGIVLPRFELRDATLREAVDLLKKRSAELDSTPGGGASKGVNIVLKLDTRPIPGLEPGGTSKLEHLKDLRLNLSLENISLWEAITYVAKLAGVKIGIESNAVALIPLGSAADAFKIREWKLDEAVLSALGVGQEPDAKAALEKKGISFPPGAAATWVPSSKRLIMKNTDENLDAFAAQVSKALQGVPQK